MMRSFTRQELIDKGWLWMVYPDGQPDRVIFEGTKTLCRQFVTENRLRRRVKTGAIRIAMVLCELDAAQPAG